MKNARVSIQAYAGLFLVHLLHLVDEILELLARPIIGRFVHQLVQIIHHVAIPRIPIIGIAAHAVTIRVTATTTGIATAVIAAVVIAAGQLYPKNKKKRPAQGRALYHRGYSSQLS